MTASFACGTQPAGRVGDGLGDGVAEAARSGAVEVVDGVGLLMLSALVALGVTLGDGDTEGDNAAVGRFP